MGILKTLFFKKGLKWVWAKPTTLGADRVRDLWSARQSLATFLATLIFRRSQTNNAVNGHRESDALTAGIKPDAFVESVKNVVLKIL